MSAVVTRPQQDSHRRENLCSNRSLSDASPWRCARTKRTGTHAQRHVCSIEQVRSALSSLPSIGANRRQTVSRLVAAPPLLFRELLIKRRSHSLDLNPDRQSGTRLAGSCKTAAAAFQRASLVSVGLRNEGCVAIRCSTEVLDRMCAGQGAIVTELTQVSHVFPGQNLQAAPVSLGQGCSQFYHVPFISHWQALGSIFPWAFRG